MERIERDTSLTIGRSDVRSLLLLEDGGPDVVNADVEIDQLGGSDLTLFVVSCGCSALNNIRIRQREPRCRTSVYVLALGDDDERIMNNTLIEHLSTDGWSYELAKYVLSGRSEATFFGELKVAAGAQRTESSQTNRNVLLSGDARVNTKPQLEIYADDVKCSHGATTGQLDEQALFYMRQRGIGLDMARSMLIEAFVNEIIDKIPDEAVREEIRGCVKNRMVKP